MTDKILPSDGDDVAALGAALRPYISDRGGRWLPVKERFERYFSGDYTGATFETYAASRFDPYAITGDDLVAVTLLSIEIRRTTTSGFTCEAAIALDASAAVISDLLVQIPIDRALHTLGDADFDRWLGSGSAADTLYTLLRGSGVPRVASHKLMARMRPHLFPIRDSVVERALGLERSHYWWNPWWRVLTGDPALVRELKAVPRPRSAEHLGVLRTADIAVWTAEKIPKSSPGSVSP